MIDQYTNEVTDFKPTRIKTQTPKFKSMDINARMFNDDLEYEDFDDIYDEDDILRYEPLED